LYSINYLRYFVISERTYFGYFETIYQGLLSLYRRIPSFSWNHRREDSTTLFYKYNDNSAVIVHFEVNLVIVEFAGMKLMI
jgi:hypothetical protein